MTAPSRVVRLRAMSRTPTGLRPGSPHRVAPALHARAIRAVVSFLALRVLVHPAAGRAAWSGLREPLAQRPDAAPRLVERFPDHAHDLLGARRVAVAADRLDRDVDLDAVERADLACHRHLH